MEQKPPSTRTAVIVWHGIVTFLAFVGLAGLLFSLVPYPGLKSFFDRLAKDGSFERLTVQFYQSFHLPILVVGLFCLLLFVFLIWKARSSQLLTAQILQYIGSLFTRLGRDIPRFFAVVQQARPPTWELLLVLVIVGFALAGRLLFIQHGMEYDESYTYIEFARHSFRHVISDYHHPNNHVLHTLLVKVSTMIFGSAPWAVRIPTFTAGIFIIPAVYMLGRKMYRPWVGLTAAGILAAAPVMINYSVNARGYTLIALFTILLFMIADFVREEKNLAAWGLMILITGLGFYTVPIMLYPFGIVFTWLVLTGLYGEIGSSYTGLRGWLRYLVGYGFFAAALSVFLYLPIFQEKGFLTVFNNDPIVQSLSLADLIATLPRRLADLQSEWLAYGVPDWLVPIFLAGMALSLILHQRIGRSRSPILLAAGTFSIISLLIQRPLILPRVWFFILPLLVLTSLAGWMALLTLFPSSKRNRKWIINGPMALVLVIVLASSARFLAPFWQNPTRNYFDAVDSAALVTQHIKDILQEGDVVVVTQQYDSRFWYYFDYYQIPQCHIRDIKRRHFTRVLVITAVFSNRTVEDIVRDFGPDMGFLQMDTVQELYRVGDFTVYQITPYQDLVDRTFGIDPDSK